MVNQDWFEKDFYAILGVSQEVMDLFSSRRRAVTAKTADLIAAYRDANLLSVLLEPTQVVEQPFQIETKLCL